MTNRNLWEKTSGFLPGDGIVTYSDMRLGRLAQLAYIFISSSLSTGIWEKCRMLFGISRTRKKCRWLFIMHGAVEASNRRWWSCGFEFPTETYSSTVYRRSVKRFRENTLLDRSEWTFSLLSPFLILSERYSGSLSAWTNMDGTFCRAQFVHRYVTFMPDTRADRAAPMRVGIIRLMWMLFIPYLKNTDVAVHFGWQSLFTRKLIVHLGNGRVRIVTHLNTSAGAEANKGKGQTGISVVALFFRGEAYQHQRRLFIELGSMRVAGVAHDYAKMAAAGAKILIK